MSFQGPAVQNGNNGYLYISIGNGYNIGIDSHGYLGFFNTTASGTIREMMAVLQDRFVFLGQNGNGGIELSLNGGDALFHNDVVLFTASDGSLLIDIYGSGQFIVSPAVQFTRTITSYNNDGVYGMGVVPVRGLDNRTGVTKADTSAKNLRSIFYSNTVYLVSAHLNAISGTSISASYTISWTEGETTQSNVLTVSSIANPTNTTFLVQPLSGTSITGQLTAIAGTGTAVNIAVAVLEIA